LRQTNLGQVLCRLPRCAPRAGRQHTAQRVNEVAARFGCLGKAALRASRLDLLRGLWGKMWARHRRGAVAESLAT